MSAEKKATGISPEVSETWGTSWLDIRYDEADSVRKKENEKKTTKQAEDLAKAQEIRRKRLERITNV